jgi:hypothetical protein
MEGIDHIIPKKVAIELRKGVFELDPPEDDSELRMMFESDGGIKARIELLKALNGRTKMWTQLFKATGNNLKSLPINSSGTIFYFITYHR